MNSEINLKQEIIFTPDLQLSVNDVYRAAHKIYKLSFDKACIDRIEKSCLSLVRILERNEEVYGITTGFGPLVQYQSGSDENSREHAIGLINHLQAGAGRESEDSFIRSAILIRIHQLCRGYSAVRYSILKELCELYSSHHLPEVPEIGSLGASGDLIPMAHIAAALPSFEQKQLQAREALAITNGTSYSAGIAALAATRFLRLLELVEELTGAIYGMLGCQTSALQSFLHNLRGHDGQMESARIIFEKSQSLKRRKKTERPLQEIYSIRCAPQIIGACRDTASFAIKTIEAEINGVSDNPVLNPETDEIFHGGNFHGQHLAFACDILNQSLTQIAVLTERQIDAMLRPDCNGNAPLLLASDPGKNSGMAGVQLTATALLTEIRNRSIPAATGSVATNGGNQDVVPLSALAARNLYQQTERTAELLACLTLILYQWKGIMNGPDPDLKWTSDLEFTTVKQDRPLYHEIKKCKKSILNIH